MSWVIDQNMLYNALLNIATKVILKNASKSVYDNCSTVRFALVITGSEKFSLANLTFSTYEKADLNVHSLQKRSHFMLFIRRRRNEKLDLQYK